MNGSDLTVWLTALIGAPPADETTYRRALTHGSTGTPDYQRLEFLGDRVLGLAVADALFARFPDEPEGRLSHRLNALVSGSACAAIARRHAVPDRLVLGKQARDDGAQDSDKVLGDVMEALIGARFLEAGFDAASAMVRRLWHDALDMAADAPKHPKSAVQEWCAANRRRPPDYAIVARSGPPHAMRFEVELTVNGLPPVRAAGASKQEAETEAARRFLAART